MTFKLYKESKGLLILPQYLITFEEAVCNHQSKKPSERVIQEYELLQFEMFDHLRFKKEYMKMAKDTPIVVLCYSQIFTRVFLNFVFSFESKNYIIFNLGLLCSVPSFVKKKMYSCKTWSSTWFFVNIEHGRSPNPVSTRRRFDVVTTLKQRHVLTGKISFEVIHHT